MSDQGEKTCPLCAEEMDLTDQQLRPCKCGYEICVWCWHHIMDMAEKDNAEGRCPACRTPYNKEKIVGTASKCERLVGGMSVEKKQKPQKGKSKSCEGRKQLGSVRVIQRNLVYIVGLPLNLADEDLLQQKEYFGRYGKVLKVSISRTASGAIQQFANSTCSVYITYSKEEEAVRSIQSAHGFVLEGRTLRACFGTTKYCHAWLRNAPCTNADCLYLHEFGPEEDSFTKDEIISAYTRNRVQQIAGVTSEMQRPRSGNLLPPPADDYYYYPSLSNTNHNNNTSSCAWPKPIPKTTTTTTTNNPANGVKVPLPNGGKSTALPAAASWGTRASQLSFKEADASSTTTTALSAVVEEEKGSLGNSVSSIKQDVDKNTPDKLFSTQNYSNPVLDEDEEEPINNNNLSIDMSSISNNQRLLQPSSELDKPFTSNETETTPKQSADLLVSDLQKKIAISEAEQDMLSFNDQRLRDTQLMQQNHRPNNNNMSGYYPLHAHASANGGALDPPSSSHIANNIPAVVNGYSSTVTGTTSSRELSYNNGTSEGRKGQNGAAALDLGEDSIISNILSMDFDPWDESLTSPRNLAKFLGGKTSDDKQQPPESHNRVLSSKNSNQSRFSFARQEDEYTDHQDFGLEYNKNSISSNHNYNNNYNSIYVDNKNKHNGGSNGFSSFSHGESELATNYFPFSENKIPVSRAQVSAPPGFSGPSRAPPPGFTSQERIEQTFDTVSDVFGGGPYQQASYYSGNHNNIRKAAAADESVNMGDIEFMDPAILAVGGSVNNHRGGGGGLEMMRSNLPSQLSSFEDDVRLQLLMQRSFSQQQNPNPRFTDLGFNYPQQTDSYGNGIPSRMMDNRLSSLSHSHQQPLMSNNTHTHWNGWNEVESGNDFALRNERLGFSSSRYYSGHEDTKFQLPTRGGDLYNRSFGI